MENRGNESSFVGNVNNLYENLVKDSLVDFLERNGYTVLSNNEDILRVLNIICRSISPRSYIGKEDAKHIICDFLDDWMTHSF